MASAPQLEAKLKEIVAGEREEAVEGLIRGGPDDYAAYREAVGFIRALDLLEELLADAAKQLEER
jgi:hypothetical protein